MLSQESSLKLIAILIFSLFVNSCNYKNELNIELFSIEIIGENKYKTIYSMANDSIKLWSSLNLESYDEYKLGFKIDYLCFNEKKDKFVSCILDRCIDDCVQDYIQFFYGAKIEDTWYFFKGANIVLPREIYQKDITKPLSFEKLHEIALKEVFRGYLKEKPLEPRYAFWKPMEYEVNEAWFNGHFKNIGICSDCKTEQEFEEVWKVNALSVWRK